MQQFTCSLAKEDYCGWKALHLSNGIVDLFVAPEIGGRIIQVRLGPRDFLYVNRRHQGRVYSPEENYAAVGWKNYGGSKVWPAPQGWSGKEQWPGPPDPVIDGGSYLWRIVEDGAERVAIYLESPPDPYTGLTFSREIRLYEGRAEVRILHTMRNTSERRVRWSIWQVTQQAAASSLLVYAPARHYRQMFGDRAFEAVKVDSDHRLWNLAYANQVAKFAVEAEAGWLATLRPRERTALVEEFRLVPGAVYPDGVPVEFWVNGSGTFTLPTGRIDMNNDPNGCDPFIETEILSPLIELQPRQEYSFAVTWRATTLPSPHLARLDSLALISDPLTIRADGQQIHLTCGFGVFQPALAELLTLDARGQTLGMVALGEFTPSEPCSICRKLNGHNRLSRVRVQLRDPEGRLLGAIAEQQVHGSENSTATGQIENRDTNEVRKNGADSH